MLPMLALLLLVLRNILRCGEIVGSGYNGYSPVPESIERMLPTFYYFRATL